MATGSLEPLTIFLLLLRTLAAAQTCYQPDGTIVGTPNTICASNPSDGLVHACCATEEECLANNLCRNARGVVYRGGCTDKTFDSDDCPQACMKLDDERQSGFTDIYLCSTHGEGAGNTATWCCGTSASCCRNQSLTVPGQFMTNLTVMRLDVDASATATASAESTSPAVVTITAIPTTAASANCGSAKVGAAVGVPLGIIAAAGWCVAILLWRRARRSGSESSSASIENMKSPL